MAVIYDFKTKKKLDAIDNLLDASKAYSRSENPLSPFYKRPDNKWDFPVSKKEQEIWD